MLNSLADEEDWVEIEALFVAAGRQLLVSLSSGDGWVYELVDIGGGGNSDEDGFPRSSDLIEDLLLIVSNVISI